VRITSVEAIVLAQLPSGIPRPAPHGSQDPLIVRIRTDEGLAGYGEAETFAPVAKSVVDAWEETEIASGLGRLMAGQDPLDPEALWRRMHEKTSFYGRSGVVIHAMSAIDIALWDIRGKAAGQPVSALLSAPSGGRRRERVPAYATVGMPADPAELPGVVKACREAGFQRVKFGVGGHPAAPPAHVDLVAAARDAMGEDGEFMIDLGRRWSDPQAAAGYAARMEPYRPGWLEEPFQPDEHAAYQALAASTTIPLAGGEADATPSEFEALLETGVAIVQPDVCRAGGFVRCLQIAGRAAGAGRRCIPHEWGTGIAKAATLHLLAAMDDEELFEYRLSETPRITRLVRNRFPVTAGRVEVPSGPGLGIEVDDAVLDEAVLDQGHGR
jgi:L-rhamnonate dehydratase